jgi:TetR/AcrR family transcriptional repressor of nem operon
MAKTGSGSLSEDRLDRAMRMFWEKGYYNTSMEEIIARTGLHRAAVYAEFGSKKKLFETILGRYRQKIIAAWFAPLEVPDAAFAQLEAFFLQFHDLGEQPQSRMGCLMCHTASEVSPHIRSVARVVSGFLDDLRTLHRTACVRARERGEVRSTTDADAVADYLAGAALGLWALARSPAPRSSVAHYVDGILAFLRSLQQKERIVLPQPGSLHRGRRRLGAAVGAGVILGERRTTP